MRNILLIIFLIQLFIYPQSTSFDFHSPKNIKLFADYLFCEGDYLRAIEQYELIKDQFANDTINFKIMLGYSSLGLYQHSNEMLKTISCESSLYPDACLFSLKNELLLDPKPIEYHQTSVFNSSQLKSFNRLLTISTLYADEPFVNKSDFILAFNSNQQKTVSLLYDYKFNPLYKSPPWAGIFSAIIPGSGKMYVGEWGDGITGLLLTSLFAYLAYDNFNANHDTRAWIFTGIGGFFYAGNIYGSIASAQIFNARIDFEFENGLKLFLEKENYFLSDYDLCN